VFFLFDHANQPVPIIPLHHDERQIFKECIQDHDQAHKKTIPQKEKGRKTDNDPVGKLGPAGFHEKAAQVGFISAFEPFFREAPGF